MEVSKFLNFLLVFSAGLISKCLAIQHKRNLIWAQTPAMRLTVSRLVGIEGDPKTWVPDKKPSVKHISAPHYGWEFKALGFSYRKQMLVWSESMNKKIQALVLNGSTDTIDVFMGTSSEVTGLVVDWLSNNVYWTDALYNWILMAPLRPYTGARIFRIITEEGLDNPHGLAVFPKYNWLFVSDWGVRPRIEKMDLLGNNRQVIVDSDILEPRGLTIDVAKLQLYWVDSSKDTVESVSLKGTDFHRNIIRTDKGTKFFDLAVFNDFIFLTEQSKGLLKVIRQDANEDIVSFTLGNIPYSIVMYDEDQQPGETEKCEELGCEHLCVLDEKGIPTCLCGEGYDLMNDTNNCVLRRQFMHPSHLYAIGVAICMYPANIADMSLDNVSLSSQCFLSDRYGYLALTFDAAENMLYYSGNFTSTISSILLESGAKATVIASATGTVKGLALDWVVGILYWTDSTNGYIKMSRKDGRFQRILLEDDVNNPLGIAVHPSKGKIYWTDIGFQPEVLPKIESANMDGSDRRILVKDNLGQPNHLVIDYNSDKLYWADSILCHIREYDLNTGNWRIFYQQASVNFYGISLYKDYVLWTDTEDMNGIHVARLDTERKVRGIIHPNYGMAADLITFDKLLQPDLSSPCNDSGQCSQLCLPRGADNYTCSCGLGFRLKGRSGCQIGNFTNDNFLIVNDAYQRNMYHMDARSGVITAMSQGEKHEPIAIDIEVSPAARRIFWSDNTVHVIRSKGLGLAQPETFLNLPEASVVDGIAVDSQNRLLYFTDTGRNLISAVCISCSSGKLVTVISKDLDEPRAIVLSPPDGMMYWSDWGLNASISEARMNGDERKVIIAFNQSAWPNGLAIDIKGRALYWADARNHDIGIYHLDTRQQRILLKEPESHYFGIFVMGDFLYVTDWKRRFVSRMHKLGGELMQFGEARFTKLYGITGFNSSFALTGVAGICSKVSVCDNTSLCLPRDRFSYICACIDGFQKVGLVCQKIITNTTTTVAVPSSTTATTDSSRAPTTDISDTVTEQSTVKKDSYHSITYDYDDSGVSRSTNNSIDDKDHRLYEETTTSAGIRNTSSTKDDENDSRNSSSEDLSGNKSGSSDKENDVKHHGSRQKPQSAESGDRTVGIIIASVVAGVIVLVIVAVGAAFYFKRRRGYQVPHTRLTEEQKTASTSHLVSGGISSNTKVIYACHTSSESLHFDEGIENPTYDVTMAMLTEQQPEFPDIPTSP